MKQGIPFLNREAINYRIAIKALGQIEDKIGNNKTFELLERQVNNAVDTGKNWHFVINELHKCLDDIAAGKVKP